jgi:chaperonin cofactor prefoldin
LDKRRHWREQEQRLVQRWNAAATRYQEVQAQLSANPTAREELKLLEQTARAEVDAVRREVAKLKVEFNSGKRY